jgi:hypothetical protein
MGNVTHVVPGLHPLFSLSPTLKPLPFSYHTKEFESLAGTDEAHDAALKAAKALALTGLACLLDASVMSAVKKEFSFE